MTEFKNIDIENEFLKGNTDFSGSLNLSDLWFLNGSDNKFSIMFFREELYEAFKIRIFRNSEEVVDTSDDSLPGSWDLMLIELFFFFFSITRIKNGFSLKSTPFIHHGKGKEADLDKKIEIKIITQTEESKEKRLALNPEGKCKYIHLTNKLVTIAHMKSLIEATSCRFMLIYILAKAYVYRLEGFLNDIANVLLKRKTILTIPERIINFLLFKGELSRIEKLYTNFTLFQSQYLFVMPLRMHRVNDMSQYWDDLYSFYRIKAINDEVISKINSLTVLTRNHHASFISKLLHFFAAIGAVASIIKLSEFAHRFFN